MTNTPSVIVNGVEMTADEFERYEERAAILEFDARMIRSEAEYRARRFITIARGQGK